MKRISSIVGLAIMFMVIVLAQPVLAQDAIATDTGTSIIPTSPASDQAQVTPPAFSERLRLLRLEKARFREARENLLRAKKAERAQRTEQLLEKRKAYLLRMVEAMITRDENLRARIARSAELYGEFQSSLIAEINDDLAKLKAMLGRIKSATTTEVLTAIAQELKEHRQDLVQANMRKAVLWAHTVRFEKTIIEKAEVRVKRMETQLTELKQAGKDVAALEALLTDARARVAAASDQLDKLQTEIKQMKEITVSSLPDLRARLQDIKEQLKAVYEIFRQIAEQAKSL